MAHQELNLYIESARAQHVEDSVIREQLVKAGWVAGEVDDALTPKAQGPVNLPPPPVPQFGMWVTFQYALLFISLYVVATSLGGIFHNWVDTTFVDKVASTYDSYSYSSGSRDDWMLRLWIASIIVSFPIFAVLFVLLKKQISQKPAIKNLRARKILIYLTMVGTFIIMIGHLIMTLFGMLDGKATGNSFAHLGVTFVVAGSIFGYLLNEVREDRKAA